MRYLDSLLWVVVLGAFSAAGIGVRHTWNTDALRAQLEACSVEVDDASVRLALADIVVDECRDMVFGGACACWDPPVGLSEIAHR